MDTGVITDVWGIILAAGASTRMKTQKLLLPCNGHTVIENVAENAMAVLGKRLIAVVGASQSEVVPLLKKKGISWCVNQNYEDGMLSSVICGMEELPFSAKAMVVFLGDQPQLPPDVPKQVISEWLKTGKGIVIPVYAGKRGHPALFDLKYRKEIKMLEFSKGLRSLSGYHPEDVIEIDCGRSEVLTDLDTPDDYEKLLKHNR